MLIRNKLTLLFTALVLAIQLAFSSFIYTFYSAAREEEFYVRLQGKARLFGRLLISRHRLPDALAHTLSPTDFQTLTEEHISIYDQNWKLIYTNQKANYYRKEAALLPTLRKKNVVRFEVGLDEGLGIAYLDQKKPYYVYVTGYDRLGRSKQQNLLILIMIGNLGGAVLIITAGWYFVGRLLTPISHMVRDVKRLSGQQMDERLAEGNQKDELAQLAMTFNGLLEKLQVTLENQRNFVSHASHELRTPLATVLGTLETSHAYDTDPTLWRQSMEIAIDDIKRIIGLTNNLLNLAKAGNRSLLLAPIRLDECVLLAIEQIKGKRSSCEIRFSFGTMPDTDFFLINGQEQLMTILLANLLDNACKYSSQPVDVTMEAAPENHQFSIIINDQGRGIPPESLPHILEPMYRGANVGSVEGYGVGLAVVHQLIQLHQGQIQIESIVDKGTKITLRFPALSETNT